MPFVNKLKKLQPTLFCSHELFPDLCTRFEGVIRDGDASPWIKLGKDKAGKTTIHFDCPCCGVFVSVTNPSNYKDHLAKRGMAPSPKKTNVAAPEPATDGEEQRQLEQALLSSFDVNGNPGNARGPAAEMQ